MNQRSASRLFSVLILTTGLFVFLSGASVFAFQEKSGTVEVTQSKSSASGEKAAAAQGTPQAPGAQPNNPDGDQTWGPYDVHSSIEFGVRGIAINGNGNKFRSDHNYDPGFRLFDASLMMKSNGPGAVLFDELMINTFGWSSDPNRYLRVNATRTNLYNFSANYRRIDYFNSLTNYAAPPPASNSQHTANTQYRQGD